MNRRVLIAAGGGVAAIAIVGAIVGVNLANAQTASAPGATPRPSASASPSGQSPSASPAATDDADAPPPTAVDPSFGDVLVETSTDGSADFGTGLSIELVSVEPTTITGAGIGSTSGPGIIVTLRAANSTAEAMAISPVVNAYEGDERVPLSPEPDDAGLPMSVGPTADAVGSYVFAVDSSGAGATIWITVGTGADSGLVVFEHR